MDEKKVRKAIEIFKGIEEVRGNLPEDGNDIEEAFYTAIEALEKQLPKKVKNLKYQPLIEDGWKDECPTCGCACGENKYHYDITKDDIYCTNCGQRLDW